MSGTRIQEEEVPYTIPPDDVICIRYYSVDICLTLFLTVLNWMWIGSWDKDPYTHRDESMFYRWYGFVFFFWLWVYGFWCFAKIAIINRRRTQELQADSYNRSVGTPMTTRTGYPRTADEHQDEFSKNTALYMKYTWFWWGLWGPMIKMSFDDKNQYSWSFALTPLLFFVGHMLVLAIQCGNYVGIDQRHINLQRLDDIDANGGNTEEEARMPILQQSS